jgi:hypothetical protein
MTDAEALLAAQAGMAFGTPGDWMQVAALERASGELVGDCALRVLAEADDRNTPVHRLLERLGFRCEARHVEADWFKGEWTTLRVYAVLEREWPSRRA